MNSTVYLFGRFRSGYSQYPDDYTHRIFKRFENNAPDPAQMMVHRNGDLIYYAFMRRLTASADGDYMGVCVVLNGVMFADPHCMFDELEQAVSSIVLHGNILTFDDRGEVVSGIDRLVDKKEEVERIARTLMRSMADTDRQTMPLPPHNYAVSAEESRQLAYADSAQDMIGAIGDYNTVYISKSEHVMSAAELVYARRFSRLHEQIDALQRDNAAWSARYAEMERRKKQYSVVMWLVILVLFGTLAVMGVIRSKNADLRNKGDIISSLNIEMDNLQSEIDNLCRDTSYMRMEIRTQNSDIADLNGRLSTQSAELSAAQNDLEHAQSQIDELQRQVAALRRSNNNGSAGKQPQTKSSIQTTVAPLTVTAIEIANVDIDGNILTSYGSVLNSSATMYLQPRITYNATESGARKFYVRWVMPNGSLRVGSSSPSGYSQADSYYIYSGTGNTLS
ncbi:MAG: hypothetical protein K2J31_03210, partial [Alistipes sp.]|nr:hypothetical protein [Alistipes sp.]